MAFTLRYHFVTDDVMYIWKTITYANRLINICNIIKQYNMITHYIE